MSELEKQLQQIVAQEAQIKGQIEQLQTTLQGLRDQRNFLSGQIAAIQAVENEIESEKDVETAEQKTDELPKDD